MDMMNSTERSPTPAAACAVRTQRHAQANGPSCVAVRVNQMVCMSLDPVALGVTDTMETPLKLVGWTMGRR